MTLGVRCPHCESQFQLDPDLLGKTMRCPHPDCREVFEVRAELPIAPPQPFPLAPEIPAPSPTAGSIADFVPVVDIAPIYEAEVVLPTAKPLPLLPPVIPAARLPLAPLLQGPREVAWDAADDPMMAAKPKAPKAEADDAIPVTPRKKRRAIPKTALALVSLALLSTLIAVGVMLVIRERRTEEKLAQEAEKLYAEGKYGEATKRYEELRKEYPGSDGAKKYEFFGRLSAAQNAIGAVAAREDPNGPLDIFRTFLGEYGESPLAQPETGYGTDIVQAGHKLATVFNDNAGDHVKEYRKDKKKVPELDLAERSIAQGRELLPQLERYKGGGGLSSDKARDQFDTTAGEIAKERTRLAVLAPFRNLARQPTDEHIEEFEQALKKAGLTADDEAKTILAAARVNLRSLVKFVPDRRPAVAAPEGSPLAFVAPPIAGSPDPKKGTEATNDTVFGMALGVFYALDAHTGKLLWGRKLHAATADPKTMDLPVRVILADGAIDWVLLPSNLDGKPALTARRTRTGETIWHQPLPHPCLGQPARIGNQLFVPLQDALGTIAHLDVVNGEYLGSLALRQPIGGGVAVLPGERGGRGFLVVPGDARRVFVLEWGRVDSENGPEPLTCVRSFATDHPKDSLRVEPLLTGDGEENSACRLTLCQGDGPAAMKLRSFDLPPAKELGKLTAEGDTECKAVTEASVKGWSWSAPLSDGERVVVATDAGLFMAFGVNQTGNADAGLFSLSGQPPTQEQEQVLRSQVIAQDEDSVWVLLGGQLVRLRVAFDGAAGYRFVSRGEAKKFGEPVARSQVRSALNRAYITYRTGAGGAVRMAAFDLETGAVAWERRLGADAVHPPIALSKGEYLIVDSLAGVHRVRNAAEPGREPMLVMETLASPADAALAPARVAVSADGRDVWTILTESASDGTKLKLQKFTAGKIAGVTALSLPEQSAGPPIAFGPQLLVPLANGYLYRIDIADKALKKGSVWRGPTVRGAAACFLSQGGPGEYLASDGNTEVGLYSWPGGTEEAVRIAGPWDARGKVSVPAMWFASGESKLVATGSEAGIVALFDIAKPLREPVRTWRGSGKGPIPEGAVSQPFTAVEQDGGIRLVYSVKKESLVSLNPSADAPEWVVRSPGADAGEILGWMRDADRWIISYQSGLVQECDGKTGRVVAETEADRQPASVAAIPFGAGRLLQANPDGTVGVMGLVPRAGDR